jgi:hypothetical protein
MTIVHFDEVVLTALRQALQTVRSRLRLPPDYAFRHVNASASARRAFFATLAQSRFQGHVLLIDKTMWTDHYRKQSRGPDRIRDGVVRLVLECPDDLFAGQRLFIDLERRDMEQIRVLRTALRQLLRTAQRSSFTNVQPSPDHRLHGEIIQVADMIAGEVREQKSLSGPYLPLLGAKIRIV